MSAFDDIDLGALPVPDIVETLDYETILAAMQADLIARYPAFDALVESDPAMKLLEVCAYRELLLRQRINDAARAVMLATATGADLDNLAALFSVARQVIVEADPQASPPIAEVLEPDASLRRRVQLALEASTAAGTVGRYLFYALGADPDVADASVTSPNPGEVLVTVLSRIGDGAPAQALLDAVDAVVQADDVRQLTDTVTTAAAQIVTVDIAATIYFRPGVATEVSLATATAALDALLARDARLGRDLPRSAIYAALHAEGVARVELTAPAADVILTELQAASAGTVTLTDGGVDA